jgi:hypothetical protein
MHKLKMILRQIYFDIFPLYITEFISVKKNSNMYKNKGIIFIHVPKAAGSSISRSVYGRAVSHIKAKDFKKISPQLFDELYTFSMVRNPYSRLYSAYNYLKQGGTNEVPIGKRPTIDSNDLKSFENFVLNWAAKRDMAKEHSILQPQHLYTHDNGKLLLDQVWKLEETNQFIDDMKLRLGDNYSLLSINKSEGDNTSLEKIYSEDMKQIVQRIYSKDFELFDYKT